MDKGTRLFSRRLLRACGLLALILGLCAAVPGAHAWYHGAASLRNPFPLAITRVTVQEVFGPSEDAGDLRKEVRAVNAGDAPVFVRMSLTESWRGADGGLLSTVVPARGPADPGSSAYTDTVEKTYRSLTASPDTADSWIRLGRYYYYTSPLGPLASSRLLLSAVRVSDALYTDAGRTQPLPAYAGAAYTLTCTAEAVLADTVQAAALWAGDRAAMTPDEQAVFEQLLRCWAAAS